METEEKLIALVKANQCIYNKRDPYFKNKHKKDQAWDSIALTLGEKVQDCQRVWNNNRTRYVKERNRRSRLGSESLVDKDGWPLYEAMCFLEKHVLNRRGRTCSFGGTNAFMHIGQPGQPRTPTSSPSCSGSPSRSRSPGVFSSVSESEVVLGKWDFAVPTATEPATAMQMPDLTKVGAGPSEGEHADLNTTLTALNKWLTTKNQDDSDQSFAQSIIASLRGLPKKFRNRAKIEILEVIDKYDNMDEQ